MRRRTTIAGLLLTVLALGAWWATSQWRGAGELTPQGPSSGQPAGESSARQPELAPSAVASAQAPTPASSTAAFAAPDADLIGGRVVDAKTGRPLPGAEVVVTLPIDEEERGKASGFTDAEGRFALRLPIAALTPEEQEGARIVVTARAKRHAEDTRGIHTTAAHDAVVIKLEATGPGITGRVVDAEGRPAKDAAVRCCGPGPWHEASTDDDGRFVMPSLVSGKYAGFVRSRAHGRARLEAFDFEASADVDVDVGTVRVVPTGVIEGRVVLPDGTPLAGIYLGTGRVDSAAARPAPCDEAADSGRQVTSDENGAFRFADLSPGEWVIAASDAVASERRTFATGTTDARIELALHVLVLSVIDEAGKPVPSASCTYDEITTDDNGAGGAGNFNAFGKIRLEFRHAIRLSVVAKTAKLSSGPLEFELPADRWMVEKTIVVRGKALWGRIRVDLVDEAGVEVRTFHADAAPAGRPAGSIGGSVYWPDGGGSLSSLAAPGRYRMVVTPGQTEFVPHAPGGPAFGPVEAEVTIVPREETKVKLVARSGGWLRVTVKASAGLEIEGGGRVVADVGNPAPVPSGMWSHADEPGHWGGGLAAKGPQWFSQPLAPGSYVLRFELPKSPATTHPFVVRAGEVTDLEVPVAR